MIKAVVAALALAATVAAASPGAADPPVLRVGSKRFTESYILGEIVARSAARTGTKAEH